MVTVATWNQIRVQIKMGLGLGCHICGRDDPDYTKKPFTRADANPHCIKCKELYCGKHASKTDAHFCTGCLPDSAKGLNRKK